MDTIDGKDPISEIVARVNLRGFDYLGTNLFILFSVVKGRSIEERTVSDRVSRRSILDRLGLQRSLRIVSFLPSPL